MQIESSYVTGENASEGENVLTSELLSRAAQAIGKKALLLALPVFVLEWGGVILVKRAVANRLCGSLQGDMNKARQLWGWIVLVSVNEGLRRVAEGFRP